MTRTLPTTVGLISIGSGSQTSQKRTSDSEKLPSCEECRDYEGCILQNDTYAKRCNFFVPNDYSALK